MTTRAKHSVSCPNCGERGHASYYDVDQVPVHSVLLMRTREQALGYPRGDIRLAYCPACGFFWNSVFDASVHEYSTEYEETQGFSPSFNAFADGLARDMVERYDVHSRDVLEIGCGKGEFLVRMCEMGDNRGIGVDPAIVPDRVPPEWRERIRIVQDLYSEKYRHLKADFVCCRHTLEHIAPTGEFLRGVREAIGDRKDTVVFFELPETIRVLEEGAFWDVYYEHCSYFSPGSLARLFRASHFELTELRLGFGDQYILLVARPTDGPTRASLPLEDDLARLDTLAKRFEVEGPRTRERWRKLIQDLASDGQRVAIGGAGSKAVAFLTTLGLKDEVGMLIDIKPYKHGKFLPGTGHEVHGPRALVEYRPDHVVVMNPIYCDEIRRDLKAMDLAPELLPV
jgi:hypothetical protein